jgi:hypothetical protein
MREFHEHSLSDCRALRKGLNEVVLDLSIRFFTGLGITVHNAIICIKPSNNTKLRVSRCTESHTFTSWRK